MYLEESSYECLIKHLPPSSSKLRFVMFENLSKTEVLHS